jgi:recombination protein RecA
MNYLFYGGASRGVIMEFIGAEGSGKTSTSLALAGTAQKQFKKEWQDEITALESKSKLNKTESERLTFLKENGEMKVLFCDAEWSFDSEWATKLGVNVEDVVFIKPENQSAEDIFDIIFAIVDSGIIGLVILDSLGVLLSAAELSKGMTEKTMAGISQPLTKFSKEMIPICKKNNCILIGINQLRDVMNSSYGGTKGVGGRSWRHNCSVRIAFNKGRYLDENYKELLAHPETAKGNVVEVEVLKNKVCPPDRKLTKYTINYDFGIDYYNDCFELGVALGLIEKDSAWYSILDDKGEVALDKDGNNMKWQGKTKMLAYMHEHEDFTQELLEKLNKFVSTKI